MVTLSLYTLIVIKKFTNATHYIVVLFFKLPDIIVLTCALFWTHSCNGCIFKYTICNNLLDNYHRKYNYEYK